MYQINYLENKYTYDGRHFPNCNCYGLVKEFYRNELGITLDDYVQFSCKELDNGYKQEMRNGYFKEIENPCEGCIVGFFRHGMMVHIAIYTDNKILHTDQYGTRKENINSYLKFKLLKVRFFKYESASVAKR